jgi:two-component system nitrogen regulation sensor histidine kinase NtrY
VTLAWRLLLAIGVITVATAAVVGFGVRESWREREEQRFLREFRAAVDSLEGRLAEERNDLTTLVDDVCQHEPFVDDALVGLRGGESALAERRLSLSLRVPEVARARRLDQLTLITSKGEVLGSSTPGETGRKDRELAARFGEERSWSALRSEPPAALEQGCRRVDARNDKLWVGIYARRDLLKLLERVGNSFDVRFHLERVEPRPDLLVETVRSKTLDGLTITAVRSRTPLWEDIRHVDTVILAVGSLTVLGALLFAYVLARGLARPIVELSRQARQVVHGEPKPVTAKGGRELEGLAASFNATLQDLLALRKRLAVSERIAARREIARQVAHEIKNPLAPIRAAVETLRRLRARDDPRFDEYFDEATRTVLDEVNRITNIVTEFTRFARLPAPEPAPFDLTETVRSVVNLHAAGGVPIAFESEPLPDVVADRDQIVQVITNLLANALDAVRDRATPAIRVRVTREGESARVSVRDNGPGVDPAIRERLFEPYATTKPEGTGLGLAIVERIAVEHGGSITYRDAPGGGAEFELVLPIAGPTLLPEPPPSSSR